jgi:hypothetical protein
MKFTLKDNDYLMLKEGLVPNSLLHTKLSPDLRKAKGVLGCPQIQQFIERNLTHWLDIRPGK